MNCTICGSNGWINRSVRTEPDKYEKWMGIKNIRKRWRKCLGCGVWHHWRNYPLEDIERIYCDGYRDPKFRGETIDEAFSKVVHIPREKSENDRRINWLIKSSSFGVPGTLLDIGSGLGVFPYRMRQFGSKVSCVEYNQDSIALLTGMNIKCTKETPDEKFDAVSITHVLEHIETPVEFLTDIGNHLKDDGKLFIEVPDAVEFELLPPIHDDFNSCHTHFYDVPGLIRALGKADFEAIDIHREHYKERNLHRIMAVCKKRP